MAQSFASGIPATNGVAQPSTCDTNTLETSTGPVQLRAEFTPEVINLKWYNDDARINVPAASNTCAYDTAISLPPNPTKPGYKFAGWEVVWDLSGLDSSINGNSYSPDNVARTWSVEFSYGTVYGKSLCSVTVGNYSHQVGSPDETTQNGSYCWCKVTGYKSNDNNMTYFEIIPNVWAFHLISGGFSNRPCNSVCSEVCGYYTRYYVGFRRALFGQSGN